MDFNTIFCQPAGKRVDLADFNILMTAAGVTRLHRTSISKQVMIEQRLKNVKKKLW